MKYFSNLGQNVQSAHPEIPLYYNCNIEGPSCIQDHVHIATKLRNRLLKPSIILPIGKKLISVSHLRMLLHNIPKDEHGLVIADICPEDRQNHASVEKITQKRVIETLQTYVDGSEGTIQYLKIISQISSTFTDIELSPLDRVYKIWHSLFMLRIWRNWIWQIEVAAKKNRKHPPKVFYTLNENFISSNAYECVELNANNLIHLISKLRNEKKDELFLPLLFNSQICETTFRQVRSMGTMNYTKVNFSLLQFLHVIKRIEILNHISYVKLQNSNIAFPNVEKRSARSKSWPLPTDAEIFEVLEKARKDAIYDLQKLGVELPDDYNFACPVKRVNILDYESSTRISDSDHNDEHFESEIENLLDIDSLEISENTHSDVQIANIRDYSKDNVSLTESSRFLLINDKKGNPKVVRKSSVLWLLTSTRDSLSSDRLSRVQSSQTSKTSQRCLNFHPTGPRSEVQFLVDDQLQIGQFCFFLNLVPNSTKLFFLRNSDNVFSDVVAGFVLSFQYIEGKNPKARQYSWDFAPVEPPHVSKKRGIEVLACWYSFDENGCLRSSLTKNSFYINMENYLSTLHHAEIKNNELILRVSERGDIVASLIQLVKEKAGKMVQNANMP